jgi:hypothetical protein
LGRVTSLRWSPSHVRVGTAAEIHVTGEGLAGDALLLFQPKLSDTQRAGPNSQRGFQSRLIQIDHSLIPFENSIKRQDFIRSLQTYISVFREAL